MDTLSYPSGEETPAAAAAAAGASARAVGGSPGTAGEQQQQQNPLAQSTTTTTTSAATAATTAQEQLSLAESLRYLSWYSAMIVSHFYLLEQAFLQSTTEESSSFPDSGGRIAHPHGAYAAYAHDTPGAGHAAHATAILDAWSVMDASDSEHDGASDTAEQPPRRRTMRRPSAILFTWWKKKSPPCARPSPMSTAHLIEAFDKYFFPSYLFRERAGGQGSGGANAHVSGHYPHGHQHGSAVAASGTEGAAATETELRTAFHEFIALGHKLAYAALSESSGGEEGGEATTHRPATASVPLPSATSAGAGGGDYLSPTSPPGDPEYGSTPLPITGLLHHHGPGGNNNSSSTTSGGTPLPAGGGLSSGAAAATPAGYGSSGTGNASLRPDANESDGHSRSSRDRQGSASAQKMVLTLLYSLAFDGPCTALANAAQLLLAEAVARLSVSSLPWAADGPPSFSALMATGNTPAAAAAADQRQQPQQPRGDAVALLMELLPRVDTPTRGDGGAASSGGGGSPLGSKAGQYQSPLSPSPFRRATPGPGRSGNDLIYTPRAGETLLWMDAEGRPHVCAAVDWLGVSAPGQPLCERRREKLLAMFDGAEAVRCGDLPRAPTLPAMDRLLLSKQGVVSGELANMERCMEHAVEVCAQEAAHSLTTRGGSSSSSVGSASRRRRAGQVTSPVVPNSPPTPGGGGASRTKQLLCVLGRCHCLIPQTQRVITDELLYSIFTEHGECPSYLNALAVYPDILRAHYTANRYILFDEGPLPLDERLMIAVMAASRHHCEYLVCRYAALLLRYTSGADARAAAEESVATTAAANANTGGGGSGMGGGGGKTASHAGGAQALPRGHTADADNSDDDETDDGDGSHRRGKGSNASAARPAVGAGASTTNSSGGTGGAQGGGASSSASAGSTAVNTAAAAASAAGGGAPPVAPPTTNKHEQWLLEGPPPRLRAVQRFIGLAAHTPWRIDEETIREVLHSGWTVPELFQLTAILAHVVPLSAFVMGLGVPVDPWALAVLPPTLAARLLRHRSSSSSNSSKSEGGGAGGRVSSTSTRYLPRPGSAQDLHLRKSDSQGCLDPFFPTTDDGGAEDIFTLYTGSDDIVSEQRIKGGSNSVSLHTLWREQFSWQEVGATYMEQYYPGAAAYLNEEFDSFGDVVRLVNEGDCVSLKYSQVGPAYAFRSLQLYVLNVLGFMVEDYPYNEINKVLLRPAKWIAQALTMRPEALSREDIRCWATCAASLPPTASSASLNAVASSSTLDALRLAPTAASSQRVKQEVDLLAAGHKMTPVPTLIQPGLMGSLNQPGSLDTINSSIADLGDDSVSTAPPPPALAEAAEGQALTSALELQDNRVLLLIMLATMFAREEGLLHILLHPLCSVLSNM